MSQASPQPLDALHCPLQGINLIEASAGTGKTWTIAALFARLLLEEVQGQTPPTIDQLLVVTYTRAATAELRDRLRLRLSELAQVLAEEQPVDEPFLQALAARFPPGPVRDLAQQRLHAAITGFDTAAIYTIHGFCQRVLSDAAFASGQTFQAELLTDDSERLSEIVDDFWRQHVVNNPLLAQVLVDTQETPAAWLAEIKPYLSKPYLQHTMPAAQTLTEARQTASRYWQALAINTPQLDDITELLRSTSLNANSYRPATIRRCLQLLNSLLAQEALPLLNPDERNLLDKLHPASLLKATKKNQTPPQHPLFEQIAAWLDAWDRYRAATILSVAGLKLDMISWVDQQLSLRRSAERSRSFDDLLTDLGAALADPERGPALAAQVARSFQVALIDEFQDTDPTQYAIFRHCFVQQQRAVFLVGDPKQAIYSFRGADIFAYLAARDDAEHHYTLDTNHRSQAPLVNTVNALFARDLPFLLDGISYQPVAAQRHTKGRLELSDEHTPFCFQWLESPAGLLNKEDASAQASKASADEITRLLNLASQGQAKLVQGEHSRALQGGDIAVLVSTHRQGERMRQALAERGVASVALTQASVFASHEAAELLALLQAWAEPGSDARLRVVLLTELAGLDAAQLLQQVEDEQQWEAQLLANAEQHRLWQNRGFMAAWRQFFNHWQVAERLLPLPDGERRLTNLAHLAELLQQETEHKQGISPLLAWLEARVSDPPQGEEALLRLESDAALVKIVTIHTAKGLQYPIVFCPFLWDGTLERSGNSFWRYHQHNASHLAPDILADDDIRLAARSEMLAEKLRLLYVALTRAQYRQYLCWGWVKDMHTAGLSWLLHGSTVQDLQQLDSLKLEQNTVTQELARFVEAQQGAASILNSDSDMQMRHTLAAAAVNYQAQAFSRPLLPPWQMASFTSLTHAASKNKWVESPDHDHRTTVPTPASLPGPAELDRFHFPRGAKAGVCLHDIFENISFNGTASQRQSTIARLLHKHGIGEQWLSSAEAMIEDTLQQNLAPGVRLADIGDEQRLMEMEFTLPVKQLDVQALIALLSDPQYGLAEPLRAAAGQLDFATVRGYLKGFIDLVFYAEQQFYLVDYKSNHLGMASEDYQYDALAASIAQEHYYLQYLIYCVALRRYLIARQIDFAQSFAGVRYLYLRGIGSGDNGIWADRPNNDLLIALDKLLS
ncbi:exodeoxyribonuclease V subunit beta [Neisseriaceae bacterium TC5R-5]|nr:exodeoxyribonuclease V subunit beta [Neisseriaceae bacterium TC5R-5]